MLTSGASAGAKHTVCCLAIMTLRLKGNMPDQAVLLQGARAAEALNPGQKRRAESSSEPWNSKRPRMHDCSEVSISSLPCRPMGVPHHLLLRNQLCAMGTTTKAVLHPNAVPWMHYCLMLYMVSDSTTVMFCVFPW